MDDYVSKPVTSLALNEIVETYLPRETASTVAAPKPEVPPAKTL